ncbi:LytR/AlgR family response regulator transcription factor [Saccharicrinis aurantiacus]|uniref:LytR/AlgR family response regulator transcription factor n=1 Tax=Saccharicrinis aurantiacus TaxID=1849719 RepID=UPI00094FE9BE|nr:LytTR family transcriptional regulator DNA-binding domain-containing protein [Saccharicrinis aurantiacus]
MTLNYIIIEDEALSAQMLESMIKDLRPDWSYLKTFDSVNDSVAWLTDNEAPDIIFLDIQLSDGLCFSIFEKVKVDSAIIFTTAYDEHAMRAFELNSVDYILKPIKESLLVKAIEKLESAIDVFSNRQDHTEQYTDLLKELKLNKKSYRKRFLVSRRDQMISVQLKEIAYIFFENKITYAIGFDGKRSIINFTLDKLEEELDPDMFIRANRQAIVNIEAISSLEQYFGGKLIVKLLPELDYKLMISRARASVFKDWLDN